MAVVDVRPARRIERRLRVGVLLVANVGKIYLAGRDRERDRLAKGNRSEGVLALRGDLAGWVRRVDRLPGSLQAEVVEFGGRLAVLQPDQGRHLHRLRREQLVGDARTVLELGAGRRVEQADVALADLRVVDARAVRVFTFVRNKVRLLQRVLGSRGQLAHEGRDGVRLRLVVALAENEDRVGPSPDHEQQRGDDSDPDQAGAPLVTGVANVVVVAVRERDRRRGRAGDELGAFGVGHDRLGRDRLVGQRPLQVGAHLAGRLIAVELVLRQRFHHDRVQRRRHLGIAGRRSARVLAHVLVGNRDRRVALERRCARDEFVEQAAGGVDVRASIDRLAAGLLRRQVLRGADDVGCLRHGRGIVGERTRDAEVHHLDRAGLGDHHIGRFDVAVHDAVVVTEVQRPADVGDDLHRAAGRQVSLGPEDVAQRAPFDVLHDDIGHRGALVAVAVTVTGVIDRDDRRMVQAGRGLSLTTKAVQEGRVAGKVGAQHLDRDLAAQPDVAPAVHLGHAPVADELTELVPAADQSGLRHSSSSLLVLRVAVAVMITDLLRTSSRPPSRPWPRVPPRAHPSSRCRRRRRSR